MPVEQRVLDDVFFLNASSYSGFTFKMRDISASKVGQYNVALPHLAQGEKAYLAPDVARKLECFAAAMADPELSAMTEGTLLNNAVAGPGEYYTRPSHTKAAIADIVQSLAQPAQVEKSGKSFFVLDRSTLSTLGEIFADIADRLQTRTDGSVKDRSFWGQAVADVAKNDVSLFDKMGWTKRSRPHMDQTVVPRPL